METVINLLKENQDIFLQKNVFLYYRLTIFLVISVACIFTDIKIQLIPVKWISLFLSINLFFWFIIDNKALISSLLGIGIIIVIFLLILVWKKNSIGWGDAVFFSFISSLFGGFLLVITFLMSFWLASFILMFFLKFKKITLKSRVPFVPFIFLGTIVTLIICYFI